MISITKLNNVWIKINGPSEIMMALNEYFTFEVPGAKFIKKKMGALNWDGKIRLLKRNGLLYLGLLPRVCKFIKKAGYDYELRGFKHFSKISSDENYIKEYINSLHLPFQLRDYQEKIILEGINEERAIFLSATSSGKSSCIYILARYWFDHLEFPKILIIVPSINLVTQLKQNFKDYSINNSWNVEENVGILFYETKIKNGIPNTPVTISTWQSAYKLNKDVLSKYNVIIFDEVHTAKAKEITKFLEKMTDTGIRYGFTGTLDDEKIHHFIIEGLFGPKIEAISLNELIEDGYSTPLKIHTIELVHKTAPKKFKDYYSEIEYIINNKKRNEFLIHLAGNLNGNTMLLFYRISHGKLLYELIKQYYGNKKNVYLIYGDTEAELRENARRLTNLDKNGNSIIIASVQIFSVGVDIPSLRNLILGHPTKSKIRLLQSIGRILRKHTSKEECHFYDIGDRLFYTNKHLLQRIKYYITEGLNFKNKTVEL